VDLLRSHMPGSGQVARKGRQSRPQAVRSASPLLLLVMATSPGPSAALMPVRRLLVTGGWHKDKGVPPASPYGYPSRLCWTTSRPPLPDGVVISLCTRRAHFPHEADASYRPPPRCGR